ncbi:site-specific integrase [Roseomonas sp. E05]|uniref:site-specific integrase n=1 Tax=Roseomonas sp. E05 TaxID=3046310 RepID=UPI0024BB32DF|nr:site-specific integrase [Roseomonas sp. E05]MDJ0390859.1 site-specific integrase [Roseomonas sp. E05]
MATELITRALTKAPPPVPPGARKLRIFDTRLRGFIMEVRASGQVTFWLRYADERGRAREVRLGRLGDITLDQARQKAEQLRAAVTLGGDPGGERDRRRAIPTLAEFVEQKYLPQIRDTLRAAWDYEAMCRRRILPALGRTPLDRVEPGDVAEFRRRLLAEGLSNPRVNRHLAVLRRIFTLALRWGAYEGRNPAERPGMLPERHREEFLTDAEHVRLLAVLAEEPDRVAAEAIRLLALTGARKNEVLRARWEHVDLGRRVLTVPLAKHGERRHIPLSDAALALLRGLRRVPGNPFVFPSARRRGQPMESVRGAWARAKAAAGLSPTLRLHDLRHSFASALANRGHSLYEVGRILGHKQVTTTTRYAHLSQERLLEAANAVGRIGQPAQRADDASPETA